MSAITGQSPANHALRTAVPDLDHRLAPPLSDLHHIRPGTHDVRLLVARTHPPIPRLPSCVLHRRLGVGVRHSRRGGCICGYPRTQAPYAVARCGTCLPIQSYSPSFFSQLVAAEPNVGFFADGLGWLHHDFRRPRADEAAPSYQTSTDRIYYEGSLIYPVSWQSFTTSRRVTGVLYFRGYTCFPSMSLYPHASQSIRWG